MLIMRMKLKNKPPYLVLKKREDFLRLRNGVFARPKGFYLQASPNGIGELRFGFTASKKIGNAVIRNRAKRRLRALAHELSQKEAKPGWDYVLIAKRDHTIAREYDDLLKDARWALREVHR